MTMTDIDNVARKTDKTFILVCANFAMLAVLFLGLGFVLFQAATLVTGLKRDLARAEQQVVELKEKVQNLDAEVVVDKVVESAVEAIGKQISEAIPNSESLARLANVPEQVEATAENIQVIAEKVQELDADEIARHVSYHMLKGMGQGFDNAAESRNPGGL